MVKYPPEEPILFYSNKDPQHLHLGSEGFGMTLQDCISLAPPALVIENVFGLWSLLLVFCHLFYLWLPYIVHLWSVLFFISNSFLDHAVPTDSYFLSVAIVVLLLINVPSLPRSLSFCLFNLACPHLLLFYVLYKGFSHLIASYPKSPVTSFIFSFIWDHYLFVFF